MPSPFDQSRYQVRFERGLDGLGRLAPADVVVVVDVLSFSTAVTDAVARASSVPFDAVGAASANGAALARAAAATGALVVLGCLRNASAVARAVLAEQERRGARTSIAIVASDEVGDDAVSARPAVEDALGAGAVIAALGDLGIDHCSPEAAVTGESFRALRGAVRHMLTASGSGQQLLERGLREEVVHAASLDATDAVPVLREGVFVGR